MQLTKLLTAFLLTAAAIALAQTPQPAPTSTGIDRKNFDTAIKPGDDFFQYVNGNWIKANPIPPEYSRWGSFGKLRDDNLTQLRAILEDLTKAGDKLPAEAAKVRDLYLTAMDEAKLEQQGITPLNAQFQQIAAINSLPELITQLARFRAEGQSFLFGFGVGVDAKQSDRYAPSLRQGGLTLPERDYYISTTPDSQRIRAEYRTHLIAMFKLLGDNDAASGQNADTIIRIETRLAQASRTPVQLRDREANYNKMTRTELAQLSAAIPWDAYFKTLNLPAVDAFLSAEGVIVGQPEFFEQMGTLLAVTPIPEWKTYLRWHLLRSMAPYLSSKFENESFRFNSTVLRGVKEMQPRWKRALGTVDRQLGEALGKLYVEKHFTPAAKKRMDELVKNLLAAYKDRIDTRTWMGADTKKQALEKLSTFVPKIGYPNKWRDYSLLEIKPDSYAANVMRANAFESRYRLERLGKPVDKTEWSMTPPTVNAYYNSGFNEIVFPAGILQPPFFDVNADDAVNYGGIGAVIGHEITHGFDDQGSRSDAQGNLRNWWTTDDRAKFTALTDKVAAQYDTCIPLEDLHINGKLTLGENLADFGGVAIAFAAYKKSLNGKPGPTLDGFTPEQRFFIGYAQVWRDSIRDENLRLTLRTDTHSPAKFRTLVPLSNIDEFYKAFNIPPGDKMYRAPADRVEVW